MLRLPPLRDRVEDFGILIGALLERVAGSEAALLRLSVPAARTIFAYAWPFNVRELEKALEAAVVLAEDGRIEAKHGRSEDDANTISGALTLLTNVVLAWNTAAMQAEITANPALYPAEHLAHIAPVAHRHINMKGIMRFTIEPHHQLVRGTTGKLQKAVSPSKSIT